MLNIIIGYVQTNYLKFQEFFIEYLEIEKPKKSNLIETSVISKLIGEYDLYSYFIKDIVIKGKSIYLILFSSKEENYPIDNVNSINI